MNPSRNNHGQQGFTLVEVIVVAVIVAALAGVAVPVYLGYVNSSRLNSATNTAGAVASFMGSCKNATGNVLTNYPAELRAVNNSVTGRTNGTRISCDLPPAGASANDPTVTIPPNVQIQLRNQAANVAGAAIRGGYTPDTTGTIAPTEWSPEYSY